MIVRDDCKEFFPAVVASYDYVHYETPKSEKVYEDISISLLFWQTLTPDSESKSLPDILNIDLLLSPICVSWS
jgi:hypothetical protein